MVISAMIIAWNTRMPTMMERKAVPVNLSEKEVTVMGAAFGSHKVVWRGDDSLLRIVLPIKAEPGKSWRYVYQITIEPQLTKADLSAPKTNWTKLLATRRVTQYHVIELWEKDGTGEKKTIKLLTR